MSGGAPVRLPPRPSTTVFRPVSALRAATVVPPRVVTVSPVQMAPRAVTVSPAQMQTAAPFVAPSVPAVRGATFSPAPAIGVAPPSQSTIVANAQQASALPETFVAHDSPPLPVETELPHPFDATTALLAPVRAVFPVVTSGIQPKMLYVVLGGLAFTAAAYVAWRHFR